MRIEVRFEAAKFAADGDRLVGRSVQPALQEALDYMGASARKRLSEATRTYFDRPNAYTETAFEYRRVNSGPPDIAQTVVRMLPDRARYLGLQVEGGTRGPGDYATTKAGPLLPGRDGKLDAFGNLPRNFVASMQAAGARWVRLGAKQDRALVLPGRGRLQVLAIVVEETRYVPRFPFYSIVQQAVAEKAPEALAKYMR